MYINRFMSFVAIVLAVSVAISCASEEKYTTDSDERADLKKDVEAAIATFKEKDSSMAKFFKSSRGYAVFPDVAKGAVGVGGAHGDGFVYEKGNHIGYASLSQGTVGFQLGGQVYSEIIFFEDEKVLQDFKDEHFEFAAQASGVAATAGGSADASFQSGYAVFTMAKGGLMYEASIGGQKFSYTPK